MSDREIILNAIQSMPEQASLTEIMDELLLLQSVQQGLEDTRQGRTVPHEIAVERIKAWISKSSGQSGA